MMKKKAGRNYRQEEREQRPDCCTCVKRTSCERYAENSFCTQWRSREAEKQGEDPNELWKRGEEADF